MNDNDNEEGGTPLFLAGRFDPQTRLVHVCCASGRQVRVEDLMRA